MKTELVAFRKTIKERCGLSFDEQREATLVEGIARRMSELKSGSHGDYLERIINDADEFNMLVSLITINETYFFREPVHLDLLTGKLAKELLIGRNPGNTVKILCAGCSTGEEPYSIAMALYEKFGPNAEYLFSITGFDIDGDALRRAEEGVFSGYSFRVLSPEMKEKFFEPAGDSRHKIKRHIGKMVRFIKLNLLGNDYPEGIRTNDVIFYRNVSIYFEPETRKEVFRRLAGFLNENGYLMTSSTETYSHDLNVLSLMELDGVFIFKKQKAVSVQEKHEHKNKFLTPIADKSLNLTDGARLLNAAGYSIKPKDKVQTPDGVNIHAYPRPLHPIDGEACYDEARRLAREKRYDEALLRIDEALGRQPLSPKAQLFKAAILVNVNRNAEAESLCMEAVKNDEWSLEGYLVLGLLARNLKENEKAIKRFKEAVYILPSCWLAHFYLGELYRESGRFDAARREYDVTINILKKNGSDEQRLLFFPISFTSGQIMHLCENRIAEMKITHPSGGARRARGF